MVKNDIIKFAMKMVLESSHKDETKADMINYLRECHTQESLLSFILDWNKFGDSRKEPLLEFDQTRKNISTDSGRKTTMSYVGMTLGKIPWKLYRKIRSEYDEATRKCGIYSVNNFSRQSCMIECKIEEKKKILVALKQCKADKKDIQKVKNEIAKLELKLSEYMKHAAVKGKSVRNPTKELPTKK